MRSTIINIALAAVLGLLSRTAAADDTCGVTCCQGCGCHCDCLQKTCQLTCEMKKEKKTSWCVEYKEFCTLLPACPSLCDSCCDEPPHCGKEKCVKQLVKKEYEVQKPVYKCVVKYLCPSCTSGTAAAPKPANAEPAPPLTPPLAPPPAVPKAM